MKRVYGSKYDKNLSRKEIAAKVRKDIQAAVKEGTLPAGSYSVRCASGNGIDVVVKGFSVEVQVYESFRIFKRDTPSRSSLFSNALRHVLETLEKLLDAYNYDGSDMQSDYFDVNFYDSISLSWEVTQEAKARMTGLKGCPECKGWESHSYECAKQRGAPRGAVSTEISRFLEQEVLEESWNLVEAYGWQPPAQEASEVGGELSSIHVSPVELPDTGQAKTRKPPSLSIVKAPREEEEESPWLDFLRRNGEAV